MSDATSNRQTNKVSITLLAVLVTLQLPLTWLVCSNFFHGYNSVAQSLSELSAEDSPVKWIVRGSLILQGALIIGMSFTATFTARAGKYLLRFSAVFLVLSALISSPSQTQYSTAHRVVAFLAFAFGCLWPAFANGKGKSGVVSSTTGVWVALGFLGFTLIGWSVWSFASQTYFGVMQRLNIFSQSLFIGWYWWRSFRRV